MKMKPDEKPNKKSPLTEKKTEPTTQMPCTFKKNATLICITLATNMVPSRNIQKEAQVHIYHREHQGRVQTFSKLLL